MKKENKDESKLIFLDKPLNEFLNKEDFELYKNLKDTLSSHICRNCRNRRVQSFSEILSAIRYFVNRTKEDNWKRSLVCGVCWHNNFICVNIRQMSEFLEKCKSSINGSLQRLNLIVLQNKQQSFKILTEAIPYLRNHQELRKMWSVRQLVLPPTMYMPPPTISPIIQQKPFKNNSKPRRSQSPNASTNAIKNIQNQNPDNSLEIKKEINNEINLKQPENDTGKFLKDAMDLFKDIKSLEEIFDN